MSEVHTPARAAIEEYQAKAKEFLLRNGWKYCFDPASKTERWANIYVADYTGKCYSIPIMRYASSIHEAMVTHSVWEKYGHGFEEDMKRIRSGR